MPAASAWSRIEAQQAAAEKAAARAARPKRQPVSKAAAQLLTITELARYLSVSHSSLYRLIDSGLPHLRIGSVLRFDLPVVMAWFADHTASGKRAHWTDDRPELQSQRGPTADLPPSRQPTADLPPGRRGATGVRRPRGIGRRINPDPVGDSNGQS